MNNKVIKKECEELWAKNKYFVLSKSHKTYLEISEYLKEKEVDILYLQDKIQKARDMEESKKDFSNAILHVWGYFKKRQVKMRNKDYLIYWKSIWMGRKVRPLSLTTSTLY